jgi:predicted nucleic acid-binding protein
MSTRTLVLDTHTLIWFLSADSRLGGAAREALLAEDARIVIPALVLAELVWCHARGRTAIGLSEAMALAEQWEDCSISPLDELVATRLPPELDIHDAIIVATALFYRDALGRETALVTADRQIAASGLVPVVW